MGEALTPPVVQVAGSREATRADLLALYARYCDEWDKAEECVSERLVRPARSHRWAA